jgi:hypothetical protein
LTEAFAEYIMYLWVEKDYSAIAPYAEILSGQINGEEDIKLVLENVG